MESLTQMIDDKILRVDKREVPGQSHKLVSELNVIKPNLRDGYGIRFENSHRSESGLSEISIKIDKETFEKSISYKSANDEKANSNFDANDSHSKSESQVTRSEKKAASDNEVPAPKDSQHIEAQAGDDHNVYGNNDSIKNKFGLGAEAEAWDNESYDDEDSDVGD